MASLSSDTETELTALNNSQLAQKKKLFNDALSRLYRFVVAVVRFRMRSVVPHERDSFVV